MIQKCGEIGLVASASLNISIEFSSLSKFTLMTCLDGPSSETPPIM